MTREEMIFELTKELLRQDSFSYNSTGEVLYDAVEMTDMLTELSARPVGSIKLANYDDEMDSYEETEEEVPEATTSSSSKKWF